MHLDDFGLLPYLTQHLGILFFCLEGILEGVLGAGEGLVFRQVVLGVLVPTQVLNGILDARHTFLVVVLVELGYTCLKVILSELPAEAAQCVKARSIDRRVHLLHLLSPRIVLFRPQNMLDQLILCNKSAQFHRIAEPSGRLTFVVVEGRVDALDERFEEELEFLDLHVVKLLIFLCEVDFWELFN